MSDNLGEKIDQKTFYAEIIMDHAKASAEEKTYKRTPVTNTFKNSEGNDVMLQQIQRNYDQTKAGAQTIINDGTERIENDPELCERLGIENVEEERRRVEQIQNGKQILNQFDSQGALLIFELEIEHNDELRDVFRRLYTQVVRCPKLESGEFQKL